jgi:phosphatidylglycerophosphate synthase
MAHSDVNRIENPLVRWSEYHAIAMLAGTIAVLAGLPFWPLMLLATLSFASLVWRCREVWRLHGTFGAANALTSARLLGTAALPAAAALHPLAVAALALILFALDGIDGWLARKLALASEFGEYLDKETDAFLMLVLCLLLYTTGRLGAWIVLPGVLRYGFVLFVAFARPPAQKERRTASGRWIYVGMTSALIAAFTPFPSLYRPFAALMTLVLLYSFASAAREVYRHPHTSEGAG